MYARLKVSIYIIMCVLDHHYCTHYTLPLHKLYRIICMSCDNIYVFFPKNWCCCSHCSSFDRFVCVSLRWCFLFARWLTPIGDMRDLNASCRRYYCYCQFSPCWRLFRLKIPNASGTRTHHHFSFATTFFFFWFGFVVHASQIASAQSFAKLFNVAVAFYGDDLNVLYLCAALVFRIPGRNDKQSVSIAAIHSAYEMVEAASMSLCVRAPATPKIPFSIEINALFCVNQRHTLTPKCLHTFLSFLNIIIIFYPIFLLLGEMSACACSVQQHSHTQYSLACCCLACFSPTFPRTLVENAL